MDIILLRVIYTDDEEDLNLPIVPVLHLQKGKTQLPLKLDFKSGDKLVINGAVLENIGTNAKILVHNESAILREKEVLTEEETRTPAARVYFALQCAYIFPNNKDEYLAKFRGYLADYIAACPSAKGIAADIESQIQGDKVYKALKETQKLIKHERSLLQSLEQDMARLAEGNMASSGET